MIMMDFLITNQLEGEERIWNEIEKQPIIKMRC
jgi:hypothetical protein